MKVIVYHPGKQHIYKLVEGLEKNNITYHFYTGLYYTCLNKTSQKYLKSVNKKRFSTRINPKHVSCINLYQELFFSLWARTNIFMRARNRLLFNKQLSFQKKLLKIIPHDVSHVITFHTNAFYLYEKLREYKTKRPHLILEAAQPHPLWIQKLYEKYSHLEKYFPLNYTEDMITAYANEFDLADTIVVPSTFLKNTLMEFGVEEHKISLIFYGSDYNNLYQKDNRESKKLNIAYCGLVSPSKGFHFLKEVARQTKRVAEFHIFGRPIARRLLNKLPSNIHLYGFVSHKDLFKYYSFMDIFYFPTLYDASGLALLEGMSFGLVPIASPYSIAPDIIENGKNGYIVEPEEIEKTVEIINNLYLNRYKLFEMSKKIMKDTKKFTWSHYQKGYIQLLEGEH